MPVSALVPHILDGAILVVVKRHSLDTFVHAPLRF